MTATIKSFEQLPGTVACIEKDLFNNGVNALVKGYHPRAVHDALVTAVSQGPATVRQSPRVKSLLWLTER